MSGTNDCPHCGAHVEELENLRVINNKLEKALKISDKTVSKLISTHDQLLKIVKTHRDMCTNTVDKTMMILYNEQLWTVLNGGYLGK